MLATTNADPGRDLRAARERLGITRAQLAGLAGCSLASLCAIEQGACPRRSRVLGQAWAALARVNAEQAPNDHEAAGGDPVGKTGNGNAHLTE